MLFTKQGNQIPIKPQQQLHWTVLAQLIERKEPRSHKSNDCKGFFSIGTRAWMK